MDISPWITYTEFRVAMMLNDYVLFMHYVCNYGKYSLKSIPLLMRV